MGESYTSHCRFTVHHPWDGVRMSSLPYLAYQYMAPASRGAHRETEAQNLLESGKVKLGPRPLASSLAGPF